jgi:hypothetical protein
MHPYLLQEIARQREEDLGRAARHYSPAGPRSHHLVTAGERPALEPGLCDPSP